MEEAFNYEDVFMGVIKTFKPEYRVKRLREAVKLQKGRLLDVGCGGGVLTETLTRFFPKAQIYGCDVSKTAIKYAKKLGSGKVKYDVIKSKKLPYKSNFFDAIVCLDVMEHVPDVNFFLKEVKRILKKDGQFFLLVPCEGQPLTYTWLFQKIKLGDKMTYENWGHIHPEFTHKYVINLLKKHGFTIGRITYSEHVLWQLLNVCMYFIPKEIMNIVLGRKAHQYWDSGVVRGKDKSKNKEKKDLFMFLRNACLQCNSLLRYITYWETDAFKKVPVTAWKIHILARK